MMASLNEETNVGSSDAIAENGKTGVKINSNGNTKNGKESEAGIRLPKKKTEVRSKSQSRPRRVHKRKAASPGPLNLSKKDEISEVLNSRRSTRKRSHDSMKNGSSEPYCGDYGEFVSESTTFQCNYCLIAFTSREEVVQHLEAMPEHRTKRTDKSRRPALECDLCGLTAISSKQFVKHRENCAKTNVKSKDGFVKCGHCDEILLNSNDELHFKLKHSGSVECKTEIAHSVYPCSVCGTKMASLNSWVGHVQNHVIESSFDCLICHCKFKTPDAFVKHVLSHPRNREYSCDYCPEKFALSISRDTHSRKHGQYLCKLCKNAYKHQKSLLTHIKRVHDEGKTEAPIEKFEENFVTDAEAESVENGLDEEKMEEEGAEFEAEFTDDKDGNWSDDNKQVKERGRSKRITRKSSKAEPDKIPDNLPCDLCDKVFSNNKQLRDHFAKDHHGKVSCIPCNLTFNHRRGLRRHRIRCHGPKTNSWVCEVCGKAFDCTYALSTHRRVHFATKKHACGVCGMMFLRAENMRRHQAGHSGNKAFMCDICGNRYTTKFILQKHAEMHVEDKDKVFLCDTCGEGFSRPNVLKWHIQSDCGRKQKKVNERPIMEGGPTRGRLPGVQNSGSRQLLPFPCPMCRKGFKEQEILDRHIKSFHTNDESLICDECGIRFRTEVTLNVHKAIHTSRKYKCSYCNKEFLRETLKQIHEREKHTGEKPHKCKFCDESFTRKGKLAAHKLIHYGREIKCEYCGMLFAKIDTKVKHMKKHTNQRPFVCNVCPKAFKEKYNLEIHMRTHANQKPFSCKKCRKRFNDAVALETHSSLHENDQPVTGYECDICGQLFVNSNDLVLHTNTHTDQSHTNAHTDQSQTQSLEGQILPVRIIQTSKEPLMQNQSFDLTRITPVSVDMIPRQQQQQILLQQDTRQQIDISNQVQVLPRQDLSDDNVNVLRQQQLQPQQQLQHQQLQQQQPQQLPGSQIMISELPRQQEEAISMQQTERILEAPRAFELHLLDQLQRTQTFAIEPIPRPQTLVPDGIVMQRPPGTAFVMDNLQNLPQQPRGPPPNFTVENLQRPQFALMEALQRPQLWNLNP